MPVRKQFAISTTQVGHGARCFIVAEVGQAHDGSLGAAHAYIDIAADAGADAVKFQTHIAAAESTRAEPFRIPSAFPQDASRYDYWKRMEFTAEQWAGLMDHARARSLVFLSSVFSIDAARLLNGLGIAAWKLGSGELANFPLIDFLVSTKKPILFSTGMSSWTDIDSAVDRVARCEADIALFQCTSKYPSSPEAVGLNVLGQLRERYGCPVGLSDHSGEIFAGLAAVALGANLLEVHVVFSKRCFGPDTPASLTPEALGDLVRGARFIEHSISHPVDKDQMAEELASMRVLFGHSIVAARDLPAGHVISLPDLAFKKPLGGLPAAAYRDVVGRTLRTPLCVDQFLCEDCLE